MRGCEAILRLGGSRHFLQRGSAVDVLPGTTHFTYATARERGDDDAIARFKKSGTALSDNTCTFVTRSARLVVSHVELEVTAANRNRLEADQQPTFFNFGLRHFADLKLSITLQVYEFQINENLLKRLKLTFLPTGFGDG